MYKIAILGCENSHANNFLRCIYGNKNEDGSYANIPGVVATDVEVLGVYSDEVPAMEKLNADFGVPMMNNYDDLVGKVDGIVITARHGDNHYKYAKPYLASGIPMFIDKPITVSEEEAVEFMNELKKNNIRICGGSSCIFMPNIEKYKNYMETKELGEVIGGTVRAPIDPDSVYGGFFFYGQHLVQMMSAIFGYFPNSVTAVEHEKQISCFVNYDTFDVRGVFVRRYYNYFAGVDFEKRSEFEEFGFGDAFVKEFNEMYHLLQGGEMHQSYEEFFAPVFVLNAIYRSYKNGGKCEKVNRIEDIKL
ncbi:MAG: Gfo/Idh/MocA family oxidoreductase [Clostridia bacterium]|nr:Gfo/Idh/MocA family oxidoreductase [Clostridia bacterium]